MVLLNCHKTFNFFQMGGAYNRHRRCDRHFIVQLGLAVFNHVRLCFQYDGKPNAFDLSASHCL
jgi:hypothetical protein